MAQLVYDFSVVGAKNVERAFASIERRATQHNLRMSRALGGGGASGRRAPKIDVAAREAQALERKTTAERIRNEKRVQAEQSRTARKAEADAKKLHRLRVRQGELDRRFARQQKAEAVKAANMAMRERRRSSAALFGRAGRSAGGALRAVGGMAAGSLAIGGSVAMGAAISQQMTESRLASQLANQAGTPGAKRQLLKEAQNVRGFTGEEALGGMSAFVEKTGDLTAARSIMGEMSKIALATGTNLEDLGRTAGQAFTVLADSAASPQEAIQQTKELLGTLAKQGNMGAVEISDLARDFGKLGAATRAFEGGAPDLLRTMGAFAQIAVKSGGAESSADASTAAARLSSDIVTKRSKFEAILGPGGIASKTDKTKLRDPLSIMLDILDKTGGDVMKTGGLFGMESAKIFKGLASTYSAGEARKKGSGREAVMAEFNALAGAKYSESELGAMYQSRLEDPDIQFKEAMKDFNAKVGSELLPVVTKLVPEFAKLIPHAVELAKLLGSIVQQLQDNPLLTIGRMIAAKVMMDLAMAHIGDKIKSAVVGSMAGAAPGSAAAGGGAVLAGGGGRAMKGVAVATTIVMGLDVGMAIGEAIAPFIYKGFLDGQKKALDVAASESASEYEKLQKLKSAAASGQLTGAEGSDLNAMRSDLMQRIAVAENRAGTNDIVQGAADMLNSWFGGKSTGQLAQEQSDQSIVGELREDLKLLNDIKAASDAAGIMRTVEESQRAAADRIVAAINNSPRAPGAGAARPKQTP